MLSPLSAVDSISPAFADTKRVLFRPFRFGVWSRMAVLGLLTGEFAGGSWSGSSNVTVPSQQGGRRLSELLLSTAPTWSEVQKYLPWIVLGMLLLLLLGLAWIYVSSVSRFILFDAVLNRRCELRQGWRHWQGPGLRYCGWEIGLTSVAFLGLAILIGAPAWFAWKHGWFRNPGQHVGELIGGGILLFLVVVIYFLAAAVISLFAKDFLIPIMALESRGVFDGWRRLLSMLGAEKGAYAGYVLMKIVLAVGSAILFGIVNVFVILFLLIPLGIAGVVVYFIAHGFALSWSPFTISAVVVLGLAALGVVFWTIGFVYSPGLVFFQSYTLHFLGSRYPTLGAALYPLPSSPEGISPAASLPGVG